MRNILKLRKPIRNEVTAFDLLRKSDSTHPLFVRLPLDTYIYLKIMSTVERTSMAHIVTELIDQSWEKVQNQSVDFNPKDRRQIHAAIRRVSDMLLRNPGKRKPKARDQRN